MILAKLDANFIASSASDVKDKWRKYTMENIDAIGYFSNYDLMLNEMADLNFPVTPAEEWDCLKNNIHQEFYAELIFKQKLKFQEKPKDIDEADVTEFRQGILNYFNLCTQTMKDRYTPKRAMNADKESKTKKVCEICKKNNPAMMNTHTTEGHRYDWLPKEEYLKQRQLKRGLSTKPSVETYLHTGATQHFFNTKPELKYSCKNGTVKTASGERIPIKGQGDIVFGDILLKEAQYVPEFKNNLISGSKLIKDGYNISMDSNGIRIYKGNVLLGFSLFFTP